MLVLCTFVVSPSAASASSMQLGFADSFSAAASTRDPLLRDAARLGANIVRVDVGWPAQRRPANPANPSDPAYDFAGADAAIMDALGHGLAPLVSFTGAPAWATGRGVPRGVSPATWRPSIAALRAYGSALARRYSGSYPNPAARGTTLPRVRWFQPWNEPNLNRYLNPQWTRSKGRWVEASPGYYRRMLNAFYDGVKSVRRDAQVVTAGTAPFGDPQPGGPRIMPLRFWRGVLSKPTRFDILDHHPYGVRGPTSPALNADDVSTADMHKLSRLLRRTHHHRPRLWATEVSYDSSPPDPQGVPEAQHARWLSESFYELWRQGVQAVLWFQVRDQLPIPSYAASYQSGVLFADGRPKTAARAFNLPFVARRSGRQTLAWLRAPVAGRVRIERYTRSGWRSIWSGRVHATEVVTKRLRVAHSARLRARLGRLVSPPFAAEQFGH